MASFGSDLVHKVLGDLTAHLHPSTRRTPQHPIIRITLRFFLAVLALYFPCLIGSEHLQGVWEVHDTTDIFSFVEAASWAADYRYMHT